MRRRICFVTGTRAEFGLMQTTLRAIHSHPHLQLQIVVTGMHLDRRRGESRRAIEAEGWRIDQVVPWAARSTDPTHTARATGRAMAKLAEAFSRLNSDIVLVVGDRVEAFAAASAAHIAGRIVAHIHGGDRAVGQVDDSLRHAITKLAHVHFPATARSARRILRLGEHPQAVHQAGSPGIDEIDRSVDEKGTRAAQRQVGLSPRRYALLVLHPVDANDAIEHARAAKIARTLLRQRFERIAIVYPNNDPGSDGIIRGWDALDGDERIVRYRNLARGVFLGLLRDSAMLIGNSSSGIIEAASFGIPVIDIGPRQRGRERGDNVVHVPYSAAALDRAIEKARHRRRVSRRNVYGGQATGSRIAAILARVSLDPRLRRKLIAY